MRAKHEIHDLRRADEETGGPPKTGGTGVKAGAEGVGEAGEGTAEVVGT